MGSGKIEGKNGGSVMFGKIAGAVCIRIVEEIEGEIVGHSYSFKSKGYSCDKKSVHGGKLIYIEHPEHVDGNFNFKEFIAPIDLSEKNLATLQGELSELLPPETIDFC